MSLAYYTALFMTFIQLFVSALCIPMFCVCVCETTVCVCLYVCMVASVNLWSCLHVCWSLHAVHSILKHTTH